MSIEEREYVIKFGNHWLHSDTMKEIVSWTTDLCKASLFNREWALDYVEEMERNGQQCSVHIFEAALKQVRDQAWAEHRTKWLYRFYDAVETNYPKRVSSDSIWINGHMYYDTCLTINQAVERLAKDLKLV